VSEMAKQGMGLVQDFQKQEAGEFAMQVLSDPQNAAAAAERRIQLLAAQGRDPKDTIEWYQSYQNDPEAAVRELELMLPLIDTDLAKNYMDSKRPLPDGTKVVGDYLVDATGNVLFDASGGRSGRNEEFGLAPLTFINPETGQYEAYQPSKSGGMRRIETPEGMEFVPDAARMGYNPRTILEKSEAETEAERIKQMPQAERALLRKQQQATMVDDTIDRALNKVGAWTTGFTGSAARKIPGTEAFDLSNLLDTIKANVGFDKLQEMREQSPTGGALGQVSDFENRQLQAVIANLEQSQSEKQLRENLELVRETVRNIVHGSEQQFMQTFGGLGGDRSSQPRLRYNPQTGEYE